MKRRIQFCIVVAAAVACLVFGVFAWRRHVLRKTEQRAYSAAQTHLQAQRASEALALIQQHASTSDGEHRGVDWRDLEIEAYRQQANVNRLTWLYHKAPEKFDENELAALFVARAFASLDDVTTADSIRDRWRGKETQSAGWLSYDVDRLVQDGKRDEAIALLKSTKFDARQDCGRLARLALLTASTDIQQAWVYLDDAYHANPRNSEVRSFRGQILEAAGERFKARTEYVAAHLANPHNPFYLEQLGEFYRRQGNFDLALDAWTQGCRSSGLCRIRAQFWGRVVRPVESGQLAKEEAIGPWSALASFLGELPDGQFWDKQRFASLPGAKKLMVTSQETFWLRVLDALQRKDERAAARILATNQFRDDSWQSDLYLHLRRILGIRHGQDLETVAADDSIAYEPITEPRHHFFEQLSRFSHAENSEIQEFLLSDQVFSALFLAAGWTEAGLSLNRALKVTEDCPDWYTFALAQALRFNRGSREALEFSRRQRKAPSLQVLIAELRLSLGDFKSSVRMLRQLAQRTDEVGRRAAWLAVTAMIERGDVDGAQVVLDKNEYLRRSVVGRELYAKLNLLKGQHAEAVSIYRQLGESSIEAMAFLANESFAHKQWGEARRITELLLERMPDQIQLHDNLLAIDRQSERQE